MACLEADEIIFRSIITEPIFKLASVFSMPACDPKIFRLFKGCFHLFSVEEDFVSTADFFDHSSDAPVSFL